MNKIIRQNSQMQPFAKQPHENQLFGVISKRYYQDELSKDFHVISSEK